MYQLILTVSGGYESEISSLLDFPNLISLSFRVTILGPLKDNLFILSTAHLLSGASLTSLKSLRLSLDTMVGNVDNICDPGIWASIDVALTQPPWHTVDYIEVGAYDRYDTAISEQQMRLVFPQLAAKPGVTFTAGPPYVNAYFTSWAVVESGSSFDPFVVINGPYEYSIMNIRDQRMGLL